MTELAQHTSADNEETQLEFDIQTGTADVAVPVDIVEEITHSPAYQRLVELRDAAYERRRSGARAIARIALVALQGGEISQAEFDDLFRGRVPEPREPDFEDYSTERPPREPDWAERAAGEGVRHPWEDEK